MDLRNWLELGVLLLVIAAGIVWPTKISLDKHNRMC